MRQGQKSLFVILLIVFLLGVLFIGQSSTGGSKLITIQIEGLDNEDVSDKVEELINKVEGIQTIFIDEKASLCTFRYDSGQVDINSVEQQLASMGISIKPVKSIHLLDEKREKEKFFSIEIEPASRK